MFRHVKPNEAHRVVAALEEKGYVHSITYNYISYVIAIIVLMEDAQGKWSRYYKQGSDFDI